MNASEKEAAIKKKTTGLIIATVVICLVSLGAAGFLRMRSAAAFKAEVDTLLEKEDALKAAQDEVKGRTETEQKLARAQDLSAWTAFLARDEAHLAELEEQGHFAILQEEFDSELLRALDDLAERTNVNFVSVHPSEFDHHEPMPKPWEVGTRGGGDAGEDAKPAKPDPKKADEDAQRIADQKEAYEKLTPEAKRPYEKDAAFKIWLKDVQGAADVGEVAIILRGTYGGIFHFIKGLAYTRGGKRFRLLVAVKNLRLEAATVTDADDDPLKGEPIITAELFAVTFAVRPPAVKKPAAETGQADDTEKEGQDADK